MPSSFKKKKDIKSDKNPYKINTYKNIPDGLYDGGTAKAQLDDLEKIYATGITSHVLRTINGTITNDPVAKQYLPNAQEHILTPEEQDDPIGDHAHTPVKGIVHRYPDRVLLKITNICAVYCRYCFRKEMIGPGSDHLNKEDYARAIDYIKSNPNIWEVILTGGDPLILSPHKLQNIINDLSTIEHVQIIRIHSRIPVASPETITDTLIYALQTDKSVYAVIHVNHAQEITEEVQSALAKLHQSGISLLSQSVLLQGINDCPDILEKLFRTLIRLHVKPYYLHHGDFAKGTSHFRTSIKEGQKIMRALQGRVSGLCLPQYTLDIPGGFGKIPLTPCYIENLSGEQYTVTDYHGKQHTYPPVCKESDNDLK